MLLNFRDKGAGFFRSSFYAPSLIGGSVSVAIVWRAMFANDGPVDNSLSFFGIDLGGWVGNPDLVLPMMILLAIWQFGATMVIFLAGLKQIPKELYEAAEMDGAGPFHRFRAVTIPLLSPVIFFNLLLGLIGAFQVFASAYIISNGSGGPAGMTNFITLYLYKRGFTDGQMGYAVRDRVGAAGRRRDHRVHPLPHPEILGALLGRQPMTTACFSEPALAMVENQLDDAATPQCPAPRG